MKNSARKITLLLCSVLLSANVLATDHFKVCWSIYAGWMPWAYAEHSGIIKKWGDKYGIDIEVVQINDYVESMNQYTAGQFDGCTMANMDALTIPAASGVDSTVLIVGDYSDGNDAVILKDKQSLKDIKGQNVNLVQFSVSHYLLARALDSVGMSERDVNVVNTADADMASVFGTTEVTAAVTWNPIVSEILQMPKTTDVFDSSKIPGEILDTMIVNTQTLNENPEFGKALVGAWYEIMTEMQGDSASAKEIRSDMAAAAETDLAGYDAQLAKTHMFYTPQAALELIISEKLYTTMKHVAEFSFEHGLLGDGAPSAGAVGIEMPTGVYGDKHNIKLRFNSTYMQMAADGTL
ncbi:putative urea ABC transporter substrate-binding protein [Gynuella sunshinyii]|uniref:ABC-type nitrate/sulfonate/bicarbonate transport system, periplasmic component n=1 Tax=Gynuella sunshinyii YC6258 TaxID=1445510 RepID=A0A0C5VQR7_9GAMM|nr:putative urea ABC transporter substrate-binding protein [Gynuella sunshinyii]AJQ95733.1 ABC-type nitrate/sulfonate/bicarbonate transport system, periplasmic component [Gynuella sunshinyii YC6258]